MDFENILEKALGIANNKKFKVRFVSHMKVETKELTYLQLGTYLITNADGIKAINIYIK